MLRGGASTLVVVQAVNTPAPTPTFTISATAVTGNQVVFGFGSAHPPQTLVQRDDGTFTDTTGSAMHQVPVGTHDVALVGPAGTPLHGVPSCTVTSTAPPVTPPGSSHTYPCTDQRQARARERHILDCSDRGVAAAHGRQCPQADDELHP